MRNRAFLTCCLLAGLLFLPLAAAAQELAGKPVRSVSYEGLETLTEDTLQFYLGVEVGGTYDPVELNSNIKALWTRSLIDDIRVEAEPEGDGVALTVTIVERPVLRSIDYVGMKRVSRSDIIDRIAKDRLEVREGGPLRLGELSRLEAAIEELYQEKGFRLADAKFTIETTAPGDRQVTFSIDEGDKVRIEDIDFEGNTVFSDRRLRWAMKKTKESGPINRVLKKDIFKAPTFDEDLDLVRELYRKEGYKNVVLGEPEVEVRATKPNASDAAKQARRLFVTLPVEEGARWKLGEITVSGNDTYSDDILLRQFKRPRGGWLRSKVIDEGLETINDIYSNTGHLFARIEPQIIEREGQVADLNIVVDEGDQYSIRRIEFEGNEKTRDKVIRRELGIQEGMVMNSGALRNSLLRIRQLEFFKVNEDEPVSFDLDSDDKTVDLVIKGEEGDRTELLFGGGFSEIDGFFGQFSFRSRNFLGRGETLGLSVQSGVRQDIFDISYFVPWFLDRPQSIGLQAYSRRLEYQLLTGQRIEQESNGATFTYGRNLGLFTRTSLAYSFFEENDIRRQFQGETLTQDLSRDVSMLRLTYNFDRRDSRLEPTVGWAYNFGIDYATDYLGGTTNFVRPTAGFTVYKPVTNRGLRTVAAFNVEAGYIEPLKDDELFFLDRFYTGGQNSIRGFNFRGIWVRDEQGVTQLDAFGFPLGGTSLLQTNLEYHFLTGGPFRVLLFADAGNVWDADNTFDLGNLRYSAGVEVRVNVPVFGAPLRFIYSENLDPFLDDRFESFQFSVGPSF